MNNDLISQAAAQEVLWNIYHGLDDVNEKILLGGAMAAISTIPAVDAAPVRHGRWICQDVGRTRFMSSDCKSENYEGFERYCPNCGAKMDLEVSK